LKGDKVDYNKHDGKDYQKKEIDNLSLTEAFCIWLVTNSIPVNKITINGGVTFHDIIYFYIEHRTKQAPSGSSPEEEKNFKANLLKT